MYGRGLVNPEVNDEQGHGTFDTIDLGPHPSVIDIEGETMQNATYRTAVWTGQKLQVTMMSINVNEDIGLEVHPDTDQFLRVEQGHGLVQMGDRRDRLTFEATAQSGDAILIPAGTWHNVTNTGSVPLKLYSIYSPPHHPHGIVQNTNPGT